MLKFILRLIFGTKNARQVKQIQPVIEHINEIEEQIKPLSDAELKDKTAEFRNRLNSGEKLDDVLPEAFACVRESSFRTTGMRHFDVQLIGGIVLHSGKISEMKTGEGKTLVATLPVYLNALAGKGVHIVTVNDYLAKRDRFWMGPIFEFLGLTVGYIQHDMPPEERKQMYNCDITYVTNNELGFDYLRDNMVIHREHKVLRNFNYAVVDEVDSILIDEARTPLIISGPAEESTEKYYTANKLIPHLKGRTITESEEIAAKQKGENLGKGYDYIVDEKSHTVTLTEQGVMKCEHLIGVTNLYEDIESEWVHHITQALRAHNLFKRDVDYVIKDGEILIVDEFTGRLMPGRRWSDGLHQAIESKEHLPIREENQTLATITFQNFFRMYEKVAGMTGTAATEADEFWDIYKLDVVTIPPNKIMIRKDNPDAIYKTEKEKWVAIVNEIESCWKSGQPVLVGTRSIEKNEKLSVMLRKRGIPHQVLNAKYHEQEARILSQAGKKGTITVATNMAGRGVDIILGGSSVDMDEQKLVIGLGGLHVLGTERHESRRIDNQLRGRSGRQGDPGSSRFFLALDDELMRLFGGERMSMLMDRFGMKEGENIEHPLISRAIENAQRKVESMNFDIRKQLLDFDNVMNKQRVVIYSLRNEILEGENISQQIKDMILESVEEKVSLWLSRKHPEEWDWDSLKLWLKRVFIIDLELTDTEKMEFTQDSVKDFIREKIENAYQVKEQELGESIVRELERMVLMQMIDIAWKEHLYELDQLKKGIGLRAYGQRDPKIEYQKESYALFSQTMSRIRESTVEYVFRFRPRAEPVRRTYNIPKETMNTSGNQQHSGQKKEYANISANKIGRNDPCPCGSGKKYKKCCGAI